MDTALKINSNNSHLDEPIRISIYESDDGNFHMKYDDFNLYDKNSTSSMRNKQKLKLLKINKTNAPKSTTETLYEIDLFCAICNHDYKSLMSLNRHIKTRKHLNQVAKMNEGQYEKVIERDWTNYESYLSKYELMPREVYNSIVQTLLEDSDMVNSADGEPIENSFKSLRNIRRPKRNHLYDCYNGDGNYNASRKSNQLSFNYNDSYYHDTFFEPNFENSRNQCTQTVELNEEYRCLVCNELFSIGTDLHEHVQQMRKQCSNIIDTTSHPFDIDIDFILEEKL